MTYSPLTFGPILWHTGHLLAANYTDNKEPDKRTHYINFFREFGFLLPCSWCRFYYQEICKLMPLDTFIDKGDNGVSRWFYLVHDLVNKKNQFRERLCMEQCVCAQKECKHDYRTTASSPPFSEVVRRYNEGKVVKTIP